MKHDGGWKIRKSTFLFRSKWFALQQEEILLPSGEPIVYSVVRHPGYSMVVPLLENGDVILEKIYRYTVQETILECPSGGLDGDSPEEAANRELQEETGWSASTLTPIGSYYGSTGISDERFYLFLGTGLEYLSEPDREPAEQIQLKIVSLDKAAEMAYSGEISAGPSALAIMLAHKHVQEST